MLIDGPIRVRLVEPEDGNGYRRKLDFDKRLRALEIDTPIRQMRVYLRDSQARILEEDEHSADRLGMLTIQQVAVELLPHVANGAITLEETIVVDVRSESSVSGVFPSGNA